MRKALPTQYRNRLTALRKRIDDAGVDALLVSYAPDQFYLTGVVLEDSAVLVTPRKVVILTDSRFDEQVDQQTPWAAKVLRSDGLADAVTRLAGDAKIRRLGIDEWMLLGQFTLLQAKARKAKVTLKPTRGLVSAGRIIKDEAEVAVIERAIRAAERGFLATLPSVRAGVAERDVAAELEYQMRKAGASGSSFEPIVATAARGSLPHARASDVRIRANQPVLFDWGAKVDGYCSDLTRVIAVGSMPAKIREIFKIVADAQLAGIAAVRAGATCKAVDDAARKIINDAGYGKQFGHGLGHGIGLDIHEHPRLSFRSDETLAAGMVVTIEPGIYLPGVGGVRIEDDVLVTATGCRVLSHLPKTFA
jgi:Xaa-Pro aminopeptidase